MRARLYVFVAVMAALLAVGCSTSPSFLLSAVESSAPSIKSNTITASLLQRLNPYALLVPSAWAQSGPPADCQATYGKMCLGWEFFGLLREYDPVANEKASGEDRIASENLFCELDQAGRLYEKLSSKADALPAEVAIAPPFQFGSTNLAGETYDQAKNGLTDVANSDYETGEANVAVRDDGTTRRFLLSVGSDDAKSGWTRGHHKLVMQGNLNATSGDVALNFVQYLKYPPSSSMGDSVMVLRSYLKGNANTHYFEFQGATSNSGSGSQGFWNWGSMQGAGYSKGAGKFYLVFYRGTNAAGDPNGVVGPGTAGGYFCIPADTTKATFGAAIYAKPQGYAEADIPADCKEFLPAVKAIPRWEITQGTPATSSDYPVDADSALFVGSGAQHLGLAF